MHSYYKYRYRTSEKSVNGSRGVCKESDKRAKRLDWRTITGVLVLETSR